MDIGEVFFFFFFLLDASIKEQNDMATVFGPILKYVYHVAYFIINLMFDKYIYCNILLLPLNVVLFAIRLFVSD